MTETTERNLELNMLRFELAPLVGWHIDDQTRLCDSSGRVWSGECGTLDRALAFGMSHGYVPNYPRDVAAALAACLEVGAANNWTLEIEKPLSSYCAQFWGGTRTLGDRGPRGDAVTGATVAEALTRLALAALSVKQVTNETGKTPPESAT